MNRIGDIINCAWEGCDKKCKRKTSKHKYCKQHRIAAKQKRTEESNAKRRREKGFPEVGDIVKCAVEECENMFLYAFRRRYCYDCAAKRRRETTKKYLIKLRENPDEYERVHLKMRRRWATYWRNNKGGREKQRAFQNACNERLKKRVLSHYGKNGEILCKWPGCLVSDIDCLTLDHIENNGKQHRKEGYAFGVNGYRQLERAGYPDGFQTLCANHQLKKEILKRRKHLK